MNKVLIAIAASVFTSTTFAANWIPVAGSFEADIQTIQRASDITSVWVRHGRDEPSDAESTYNFLQIKCATSEFRVRTIIQYSLPKGQGKAVFHKTGEIPFSPIAPETIGHYIQTLVCTSRR